MINVTDSIAKRIQYALSIRGMKQVDLVEKTQIPKGSISQYISGYVEPKSDRIYLIAKALDVNPVWLMGVDVPMERETLESKYDIENARLLNEVKNNEILREFVKTFLKLNETNQRIIITMVNTMYNEMKDK